MPLFVTKTSISNGFLSLITKASPSKFTLSVSIASIEKSQSGSASSAVVVNTLESLTEESEAAVTVIVIDNSWPSETESSGEIVTLIVWLSPASKVKSVISIEISQLFS